MQHSPHLPSKRNEVVHLGSSSRWEWSGSRMRRGWWAEKHVTGPMQPSGQRPLSLLTVQQCQGRGCC